MRLKTLERLIFHRKIESVESILKAFDMTILNLRLEYKNFIDNFVKTRLQLLYDIDLLYIFDIAHELLKEKEKVTINKRRTVELEGNKW